MSLVLTGYYGAETDADGRLTEEAKESIEKRLEEVMERLPIDSERPTKGTLQKKYLANRAHCIAADKAIQSVTATKGLQHFKVTSVAGVLAANEVQYDVLFEQLPDDVKADSVGMARRSCVLNTQTKETRLEVPWGSSMPSLWAVTDGGSDTWQHRLKLFYKYQLRGSEKYDSPHHPTRVRDRTVNAADGGG